MSLIFKKEYREDLRNSVVYINDTTETSPEFFRVSDVPGVLRKGKNLIKIKAHPTNLVNGSKVLIDVRDSNGDEIYFEIPDYITDDKSRIISIWVYNDKGDDNTANGDAIITIIGETNISGIPNEWIGRPNVKWSRVVSVDRDSNNVSSVIFDSDNLPSITVSESIETYDNLPLNYIPSKDLYTLSNTKTSGGTAKYTYKGSTPIIQITNTSTFNSEMVGATITLSTLSIFDTPSVRPQTTIENPLNNKFYRSTIVSLLDNKTIITDKPYSTTFKDRVDLVHTFNAIDSTSYTISYPSTGSNSTTENKKSFANISLSNVDPIIGVVDKVKILIKSSGLPGEYELLNEVKVPFSSSFDLKIPIPTRHLRDAKTIRVQYLNSSGDISDTITDATQFVFKGGNKYIEGDENIITGSTYLSDTIGSGIQLQGGSNSLIKTDTYNGQTSASLGLGSGGILLYSGSTDIGADSLSGVGFELVADNDTSHLIFNTSGSGKLDIKADSFFVGDINSQYISASNGSIEISSSNFFLSSSGEVIVDVNIDSIGGLVVTDNSISSSLEISSSLTSFAIKSNGEITGSNVLIQQNYGGTVYPMIDSTNGVIDFKNIGRQLISDHVEYVRYNVSDGASWGTVSEYPITLLYGDTNLGISFQAKNILGAAAPFLTSQVRVSIATAQTASAASKTTQYYDSWNSSTVLQTYNLLDLVSGDVSSSISVGPDTSNAIKAIPSDALGRYCKIILELKNNAGTPNAGTSTRIKNFSVVAIGDLASDFISGVISPTDNPVPPT